MNMKARCTTCVMHRINWHLCHLQRRGGFKSQKLPAIGAREIVTQPDWMARAFQAIPRTRVFLTIDPTVIPGVGRNQEGFELVLPDQPTAALL